MLRKIFIFHENIYKLDFHEQRIGLKYFLIIFQLENFVGFNSHVRKHGNILKKGNLCIDISTKLNFPAKFLTTFSLILLLNLTFRTSKRKIFS